MFQCGLPIHRSSDRDMCLLAEVLNGVRLSLFEQAAQQHPAAYDPCSNCATEATCKRVGGLLRTPKLDFKHRFHRKMTLDHSLFTWLTNHVGWILTVRERLTDGRTPYQLARGSKFNRECLAFGENVFYKLNAGQLKRANEGKLGPDGQKAFSWATYETRTNRCLGHRGPSQRIGQKHRESVI